MGSADRIGKSKEKKKRSLGFVSFRFFFLSKILFIWESECSSWVRGAGMGQRERKKQHSHWVRSSMLGSISGCGDMTFTDRATLVPWACVSKYRASGDPMAPVKAGAASTWVLCCIWGHLHVWPFHPSQAIDAIISVEATKGRVYFLS